MCVHACIGLGLLSSQGLFHSEKVQLWFFFSWWTPRIPDLRLARADVICHEVQPPGRLPGRWLGLVLAVVWTSAFL